MAKFTIKYSKLIKNLQAAVESETSTEISESEACGVADYLIEALDLDEHSLIKYDVEDEEESY